MSNIVEPFPAGIHQGKGKEGAGSHRDFNLCIPGQNWGSDYPSVQGNITQDICTMPHLSACECVLAGLSERRSNIDFKKTCVVTVQSQVPELKPSCSHCIAVVGFSDSQSGEDIGTCVWDSAVEFEIPTVSPDSYLLP